MHQAENDASKGRFQWPYSLLADIYILKEDNAASRYVLTLGSSHVIHLYLTVTLLNCYVSKLTFKFLSAEIKHKGAVRYPDFPFFTLHYFRETVLKYETDCSKNGKKRKKNCGFKACQSKHSSQTYLKSNYSKFCARDSWASLCQRSARFTAWSRRKRWHHTADSKMKMSAQTTILEKKGEDRIKRWQKLNQGGTRVIISCKMYCVKFKVKTEKKSCCSSLEDIRHNEWRFPAGPVIEILE